LIRCAELVGSFGLLMCTVALFAYKILRPPTSYIFMLCHLHTILLTYLRFIAVPDSAHSKLFHAGFLCSWFGTMLALAMPDLRGLWFGEIVLFYVQHYLLLIVPMLWIAQRRYTLYDGFPAALVGWILFLVVQFDLHFAVSLTFTSNVSYMLVPPVGGPLRSFGSWYRLVFAAASLPMGLLCLGLVRVVAWLTGAFHRAAVEEVYVSKARMASSERPLASCSDAEAAARSAAAEANWLPIGSSNAKSD
jgi:hypothetical protein